MTAAVAWDALPWRLPVQDLVRIARHDPTLARADLEAARVGTTADVEPAGYTIPTEAEAVQAKPAAEPPLNRNPGRLFGN